MGKAEHAWVTAYLPTKYYIFELRAYDRVPALKGILVLFN